jgi:glucan biosynthesis protein
VHDSDGLLVHSSSGEWLWRPLGNPEKLRVSYFEFDNPRGFGLLQRDRRFQNYEDLETRHELRPNAWVVPVGNWGKGQVKLVEIPSRKETNDNIVAYWLPRVTAPVGQAIDIAYRINFQSTDLVDAGAGRVTAMRIGAGDKEEWKRFVIDFEGQKLRSLGSSTPVKAVINVGPDGQLVQQNLLRNPVNGGWRLSFQVRPPKGRPLELRAFFRPVIARSVKLGAISWVMNESRPQPCDTQNKLAGGLLASVHMPQRNQNMAPQHAKHDNAISPNWGGFSSYWRDCPSRFATPKIRRISMAPSKIALGPWRPG